MVEVLVFVIGAAIVLGGALGVLLLPSTNQAALSLIATLFGVAVLFVAQEAHFLAAVQIIVYAGAIVVLFLFVMMLLGVKSNEDLSVEPLPGQRIAALVGGGLFFLMVLAVLVVGGTELTGSLGNTFPDLTQSNLASLGKNLFTEHIFAVQATAILLTVAVVGAVVLVGQHMNSNKKQEATK
ncbi:MAG: NADH-quinone oxidoreductase subunit J [Acidimicrobiia bacterium]